MSFRYQQTTGKLWHDDAFLGLGYAGHGAGLNNHDLQASHGVGPLPVGEYTIGPPKAPPDHLGPLAMPLEPKPGTEMFGRSAIFIHGDNPLMNHTASDGCLVLRHDLRQYIATARLMGDDTLTVFA